MGLSPTTMMYAARAVGDVLSLAGVPSLVADHMEKDPGFLKAVTEHMRFVQTGQVFGRSLEGALLSLAVSHAAGRMTAGVHTLADDVEAAWPTLDAQHRHEIATAIIEARETGGLGMAVDEARWNRILEMAGHEVEAREERAPAQW